MQMVSRLLAIYRAPASQENQSTESPRLDLQSRQSVCRFCCHLPFCTCHRTVASQVSLDVSPLTSLMTSIFPVARLKREMAIVHSAISRLTGVLLLLRCSQILLVSFDGVSEPNAKAMGRSYAPLILCTPDRSRGKSTGP